MGNEQNKPASENYHTTPLRRSKSLESTFKYGRFLEVPKTKRRRRSKSDQNISYRLNADQSSSEKHHRNSADPVNISTTQLVESLVEEVPLDSVSSFISAYFQNTPNEEAPKRSRPATYTAETFRVRQKLRRKHLKRKAVITDVGDQLLQAALTTILHMFEALTPLWNEYDTASTFSFRHPDLLENHNDVAISDTVSKYSAISQHTDDKQIPKLSSPQIEEVIEIKPKQVLESEKSDAPSKHYGEYFQHFDGKQRQAPEVSSPEVREIIERKPEQQVYDLKKQAIDSIIHDPQNQQSPPPTLVTNEQRRTYVKTISPVSRAQTSYRDSSLEKLENKKKIREPESESAPSRLPRSLGISGTERSNTHMTNERRRTYVKTKSPVSRAQTSNRESSSEKLENKKKSKRQSAPVPLPRSINISERKRSNRPIFRNYLPETVSVSQPQLNNDEQNPTRLSVDLSSPLATQSTNSQNAPHQSSDSAASGKSSLFSSKDGDLEKQGSQKVRQTPRKISTQKALLSSKRNVHKASDSVSTRPSPPTREQHGESASTENTDQLSVGGPMTQPNISFKISSNIENSSSKDRALVLKENNTSQIGLSSDGNKCSHTEESINFLMLDPVYTKEQVTITPESRDLNFQLENMYPAEIQPKHSSGIEGEQSLWKESLKPPFAVVPTVNSVYNDRKSFPIKDLSSVGQGIPEVHSDDSRSVKGQITGEKRSGYSLGEVNASVPVLNTAGHRCVKGKTASTEENIPSPIADEENFSQTGFMERASPSFKYTVNRRHLPINAPEKSVRSTTSHPLSSRSSRSAKKMISEEERLPSEDRSINASQPVVKTNAKPSHNNALSKKDIVPTGISSKKSLSLKDASPKRTVTSHSSNTNASGYNSDKVQSSPLTTYPTSSPIFQAVPNSPPLHVSSNSKSSESSFPRKLTKEQSLTPLSGSATSPTSVKISKSPSPKSLLRKPISSSSGSKENSPNTGRPRAPSPLDKSTFDSLSSSLLLNQGAESVNIEEDVQLLLAQPENWSNKSYSPEQIGISHNPKEKGYPMSFSDQQPSMNQDLHQLEQRSRECSSEKVNRDLKVISEQPVVKGKPPIPPKRKALSDTTTKKKAADKHKLLDENNTHRSGDIDKTRTEHQLKGKAFLNKEALSTKSPSNAGMSSSTSRSRSPKRTPASSEKTADVKTYISKPALKPRKSSKTPLDLASDGLLSDSEYLTGQQSSGGINSKLKSQTDFIRPMTQSFPPIRFHSERIEPTRSRSPVRTLTRAHSPDTQSLELHKPKREKLSNEAKRYLDIASKSAPTYNQVSNTAPLVGLGEDGPDEKLASLPHNEFNHLKIVPPIQSNAVKPLTQQQFSQLTPTHTTNSGGVSENVVPHKESKVERHFPILKHSQQFKKSPESQATSQTRFKYKPEESRPVPSDKPLTNQRVTSLEATKEDTSKSFPNVRDKNSPQRDSDSVKGVSGKSLNYPKASQHTYVLAESDIIVLNKPIPESYSKESDLADADPNDFLTVNGPAWFRRAQEEMRKDLLESKSSKLSQSTYTIDPDNQKFLDPDTTSYDFHTAYETQDRFVGTEIPSTPPKAQLIRSRENAEGNFPTDIKTILQKQNKFSDARDATTPKFQPFEISVISSTSATGREEQDSAINPTDGKKSPEIVAPSGNSDRLINMDKSKWFSRTVTKDNIPRDLGFPSDQQHPQMDDIERSQLKERSIDVPRLSTVITGRHRQSFRPSINSNLPDSKLVAEAKKFYKEGLQMSVPEQLDDSRADTHTCKHSGDNRLMVFDYRLASVKQPLMSVYRLIQAARAVHRGPVGILIPAGTFGVQRICKELSVEYLLLNDGQEIYETDEIHSSKVGIMAVLAESC